MIKELNILLVEDNEGDIRIIKELLKDQSLKTIDVTCAGSLKSAIESLSENNYDAILLDLGLPDSFGIDTFIKLNQTVFDIPATIILTGLNDSETGLLAVNKGAQDYIVKGQIDSEKLIKSIVYGTERNRLNTELKKQLEARKKAEDNAVRINRLLKILSNTNHAIIKINNKSALIDEVCTNLVKIGEFYLVAGTFKETADNYKKCFVSEGESDCDEATRVFIEACHRKVLKTSKALIINNLGDPGAKYPENSRFDGTPGSLAVLPVGINKDGTIAIFSDRSSFFDEDELELLYEIIDDITFAFSTIEKADEKSISDEELKYAQKAAVSLYNLSQKTDLPDKELIRIALEMAVEITKSKLGYLHFVNEDQISLDLFAWSEETLRICTASKDPHYPLSSAGIWADPARTGRPAIHNDYENHPGKKGVPDGHVQLFRHMSVPVSDDNRIVLIAGVGNKEEPYTETDSNHFMLLMNEMWKIIMRNRMIAEIDWSKEKLDLIAKRTSAVMYQTNSSGSGFDYIHDAIESLTGYNVSEIMSSGLVPLIRKAEQTDGEIIRADLLGEMMLEKTLKEFNCEYLIETKNGELKWLNDKSFPLLNENGGSLGAIGILLDISNIKESEIELQTQKSRSDQLFSNSPVAIVQLDAEGIILNTNSGFENMFGFNKTEVIGEILDELIVPDELKDEGLSFYDDTVKGRALSKESIRKRKDSSVIYVSVTGVPIKSKGEITGYFAMYSDITKQKLAEEALIKARDKAEEGDRLKTAFLHNISHEIRTPMNAIAGFSALLSQPGLDEETRNSFVDTIVQSSDHLLNIINDIVEVSNIEADQVKITRAEVDLNDMIADLAESYMNRIQKNDKSLKIFTKIPENREIINTDSSKLNRVLCNLLDNAIKFTSKGKIEVGYKRSGQQIEFFVSDTGIGINELHLNRIFDRFYQVEYADNRQYEGTGLGLSICKSYVELMGGKIWVTSSMGKGSVFTFTIPSEQLSRTGTAGLSSPEKGVDVGKGRKILVAEDIESNFKLIKYFLSGFDLEIIHAENGKEAVDLIKQYSDINLILMDIKMPVMDGFTAVKIIRQFNESVPIIAQTAFADDSAAILSSGCNGFISKPFQKQQLITAINDFLRI